MGCSSASDSQPARSIRFSIGLTAPAHLRRCASAQPVANEAGRPETHACAPSRQVAHTLHSFVAVGTTVTRRPPHRTVRAGLLHTAPTLDV